MARGLSRADQNKKIRQEALREQLANGKHLEHVIDISKKLSDLEEILDNLEVQRLKAAADIKLKLVNKYLPDVKAVELSGADGADLNIFLTPNDAEVL